MKLAYRPLAAAAAVLALAGCGAATPASAPSPVRSPAPVTILKMSGSGIQLSKPFAPGTGPVTVNYLFDCSSAGKSGNVFTADMISSGQGLLVHQDASIASDLNIGDKAGNGTTTIYPKYPEYPYYVEVTSNCSWSISLTQG